MGSSQVLRTIIFNAEKKLEWNLANKLANYILVNEFIPRLTPSPIGEARLGLEKSATNGL